MTEGPAAAPARERIVTVLATQLHQDRRSLLRGSAVFAGANLALAALVWAVPGGPLAWAVVVTAFLGSVFFALTVDWEFSRLTLWRREIARLGAGDESADAIGALLADPHTARPGRALKWIVWAITGVWLLSLLALIRGTGIEWTGLL
ncbi:MAG: hypothetical protein ACREK2_07695 [Gemmatimonadota bacterium]